MCLILMLSLQVCWEKFCEYWDVEGRYVPVTKDYPVRLAFTEHSLSHSRWHRHSNMCHMATSSKTGHVCVMPVS